MKALHVFAAILLLVIIGVPGCKKGQTEPNPVPPPAPVSTLKGAFESQYKRYAKGDKHSGQQNPASIETIWQDTVWRNDRIHRQLILWMENDDAKGLSYSISDLKNGSSTIAAANIKLRFPKYVIGDAKSMECNMQLNRTPVYIADALSEESVSSASNDEPAKIWITVDIPKQANPGVYEGTIDVNQNGEKKLTFALKFLVTNQTLPDVKEWSFHLDLWQFPFQLTKLCAENGVSITPFTDEYENLMAPFYRMLADAGQKVATTYIKDGAFRNGETMIRWNLKADKTWSYSYANFDRFVSFMSSLGIDRQISCFSLAGWSNSVGYFDEATGTYSTMDLPIGSNEFNAVWSDFLTSFRAHLISKGWFNKTVLYMDETKNDDMRKIVNLIRQNGTDWKIGLAGGRLEQDVEQELYDYSTVLGYNRASTNNPVSTFYTSCSQVYPNSYVTPEASPAEMEWMPWYALARGYNGYLRWAYDYWLSSDPTNIQDGSNTAGDFNLIYRTGNKASSKAISSIRLELLRQGIQEYEKVKILNDSRLNNLLVSFRSSNGRDALALVKQGNALIKKVSAGQ